MPAYRIEAPCLHQSRFDYVIRFRGNIAVTATTGETRTAAAWVRPGGRARVLRGAAVTADRYAVGTLVCVQGFRACRQRLVAVATPVPLGNWPGGHRWPGARSRGTVRRALALPLQHDLAFPRRHARQDRQHELAGRVTGVQTLAAHGQDHQADAASTGRPRWIAVRPVLRASLSGLVTVSTSPSRMKVRHLGELHPLGGAGSPARCRRSSEATGGVGIIHSTELSTAEKFKFS
jgi:hypothetical protein